MCWYSLLDSGALPLRFSFPSELTATGGEGGLIAQDKIHPGLVARLEHSAT
jgi:hypothetical protein